MFAVSSMRHFVLFVNADIRSITGDDIPWIQKHWGLPLVLKGIQCVEVGP